jgi:hypothetical protein
MDLEEKRIFKFLKTRNETVARKKMDSVDQEHPDVNLLLKHMLYANHLQRKTNSFPLIDLDQFSGKSYSLRQPMHQIHATFCIHREYPGSGNIFQTIEAKRRLEDIFPIIQFLNFKNYRLVGGSCISAIRGTINGHIDLDFFPLVGEIKDLIQRETRANEIYKEFLNEVQKIYDRYYSESHTISFVRSEDCTTIFLYEETPVTKIQFVHRAFQSEMEMVNSADLMPCQILYDGERFRCTYSAMLSLQTNIIPVDFTRFSPSFAHRLEKYCKEKHFILAFCGLDRDEIWRDCSEEFDDRWISKLPSGIYFDKSAIGADFVGMRVLLGNEPKAFYSSSPSQNPKRLGKFNLVSFLNGRSLHLFANSAREMILAPKKTKIGKVFSRMTSIEGDLYRTSFKFFFGETLARDACIAHFDGNKTEYEKLVQQRTVQIEKEMNDQFSCLRQLKWRLTARFSQTIGSMNPVKMTASEFYGAGYNGFKIPICRPEKVLLKMAWKSKSSIISRLPKDVLQKIFLLLDLAEFERQKVEINSLFKFKKELPRPDQGYFNADFDGDEIHIYAYGVSDEEFNAEDYENLNWPGM